MSVLSRQSSTSTYPANINVHRIEDSYPDTQLLSAFQGKDAIICALSLQNTLQQIKFIDAAVRAGVKWFIPSEFGANREMIKDEDILWLSSPKDQVIDCLRKAESQGLSWTALATGPFLDW